MSTCLLAWLTDVAAGYQEDAQTSQILAELSWGKSQHGKFALKNGIVRYDGRI